MIPYSQYVSASYGYFSIVLTSTEARERRGRSQFFWIVPAIQHHCGPEDKVEDRFLDSVRSSDRSVSFLMLPSGPIVPSPRALPLLA